MKKSLTNFNQLSGSDQMFEFPRTTLMQFTVLGDTLPNCPFKYNIMSIGLVLGVSSSNRGRDSPESATVELSHNFSQIFLNSLV